MGGLKEEEPPGPGLASANGGGQQTLKGVTPIAELHSGSIVLLSGRTMPYPTP